MENDKFSYDSAIQRVEEIVQLLESGDKGMDELSDLVKEAASLVQQCKEKLRMTEDEIHQVFKEKE